MYNIGLHIACLNTLHQTFIPTYVNAHNFVFKLDEIFVQYMQIFLQILSKIAIWLKNLSYRVNTGNCSE